MGLHKRNIEIHLVQHRAYSGNEAILGIGTEADIHGCFERTDITRSISIYTFLHFTFSSSIRRFALKGSILTDVLNGW